MGINSITCKGGYAETGKVEFGKGIRTSSDFDGTDLLKGATLVALMAAGTFVAGCVGKDAPADLEQPRYRFNRFGDTKTIRDEATNKTYELEFDGLKERWDYGTRYDAATFNVYDMGAQGKTRIGDIELISHSLASQITLASNDMTLPGTKMELGVDIGKGYVDLKVTER